MKVQGYCILPEEKLPEANEYPLDYSISINKAYAPKTPSIATELSIISEEVVEVLTQEIDVTEWLTERKKEKKDAREKEVEYEVELNLQEASEYDLIGVDEQIEEVPIKFVSSGERNYTMHLPSKSISLLSSSVDTSKHIVLLEDKVMYVDKICNTKTCR
ncbi:hypothetical protein NEFER03_1028 [Nematocida sp. LUAm3]|nr:hypothetical protein NEFER03_1028 [Nematocida sp. LUAm3]KAI5175368.1 hypothetical protein NEFER02_1297 [Nematocida sp. LUAm2]KAI5177675.1 hypothetical protein NEFER01_0899 [Nematocida sp. LUAm1]